MQTEGDHSTASMLPGARWVRWGLLLVLILVPDVVQSEWYLTLSEDPGAHEEPGAPAEAWSFADLAALAAQSYPSITARLQEREAAEGDRRVAGWARFPTPGVEASVDDNEVLQTVLSLQQPLWTGGRITAGIQAAEAREEAAVEEVDATRQDVLIRLADNFAELRKRQKQLRISDTHVEELEALQAMIDRRVARRVSPESDLDLASSRLAQARSDRASVVQSLRRTRASLSQLAGVDVTRVEEGRTARFVLPQDLPSAQSSAEGTSPVLSRLSAQGLAARADVRTERANRFPTLALRLEQREQRGDAILPDNRSDTRLLVVVESNFGPGLSTGDAISAARSRESALLDEREAALRDLRTEVADAWYEVEAARARLASARLNRDSSARVAESYRRQYVIGQKTWLDVMNAVREAANAALSVEEARADELRASLRLALLTDRAEAFLNALTGPMREQTP